MWGRFDGKPAPFNPPGKLYTMEKSEEINPTSQAGILFNSLFKGKADEQFILIFTLPGEKSTWFDNIEDAAKWAEKQVNRNVYFGVSLSPDPEYLLRRYTEENPSRYKHKTPATIRCQAKDVTAMPGLWIDLDFLDPGHKKTNLPGNLADALEILNRMNLQPTIIINSGGGLQAWWIFKELWQFSNSQERNHAALLIERFQNYVKKTAYKYGEELTGQPFDVDSTHDLARVFRVPGTLNVKNPTDPKLVKIIDDSGPTYSPQEIEGLLDKEKVYLSPKPAKAVSDRAAGQPVRFEGFTLSAQAAPDFNTFMALLNDPEEKRFKQSWEHKRKDFIDQSASSYDLSLATLAFAADWKAQEVINLLISHRREQGEQLKLDRPDYYQNTINRAKQAFEKGFTTPPAEAFAEQAKEEDPPNNDKVSGKQEQDILKELSAIFGVKIEKFIRYLTNPVIFHIIIDGKKVTIGEVSSVMSQTKFKQSIFLASRVALPNFKAKMWNHILNQLGRIEEEIEPDETETEEGLLRYWLRKYLSEKALALTPEEGIADARPWISPNNCIAIQLQEFKQFVKMYKEFDLSKSISFVLGNIGAVKTQENYKADNLEYKSKSCWVLPREFNLKKETDS